MNCGDKSISIGETTLAQLDNIKVLDLILFLAVKDSSNVSILNLEAKII